MKGYVKIETGTYSGAEGLHISAELDNVNFADRIALVHGLCKAVHISTEELVLITELISSGLMDELSEVVDLTEEAADVKLESAVRRLHEILRKELGHEG